MRVLVACEFSSAVRDAFARRGHDAWSCDLLPSETAGQHHQGRLEDFIGSGAEWDLIVGHPPCTFICNSGVQHLYRDGKRFEPRWKELEFGCAFFNLIRNRDCPRIAIENPIPHKYALELIGTKYSQVIHPWQFGHGESKATCLWLKGLPPLLPTHRKDDLFAPAEPAARVQRLHRLPPGPTRAKERSRTYSGIAEAMADQWGNL